MTPHKMYTLPVLLSLALLGSPAGETAPRTNELGENEQMAVIDELTTLLREGYVHVEVGDRTAGHLEDKFMQGAYESLRDRRAFAVQLTKDAQEISRDQ